MPHNPFFVLLLFTSKHNLGTAEKQKKKKEEEEEEENWSRLTLNFSMY